MRRTLLSVFLCLFSVCLMAANKASRELADILVAMAKEQSIHPDSLYPHIRTLELRKDACTDPAEKAVMQAALGYLYHQRSYRTMSNEYLSDMDSTDMKTWSRDEWDHMAALRYSEALSNMDVLHRTTLSDWAPLVKKGEHDKIFDNDMLMLVWRSAQSIGAHPRKIIPSYQDMVEYYEKQGNRRAVLVLTLEHKSWYGKEDRAELLRLRDKYADLNECGEIYYYLAFCESKDSAKVALLQEGIKRYPRYVGVDKLKKYLQEIVEPTCQWSMNTGRPYPGETYDWVLRLKHVSQVKFSIYRLKDATIRRDYVDSKNPLKFLRKNAVLVSEQMHVPARHPEWEEYRDTLKWTAPETGDYVLVVHPATSMKLEDKVEPSFHSFAVTRLFVNYISLPNDKMRILVNDALTGCPQEGVSIDLYAYLTYKTGQPDDTTYFSQVKTDTEGRAEVSCPKNVKNQRRSDVYVHVHRPGDTSHPVSQLSYLSNYYNPKDDRARTTNMYTDRSIYRPGQTVHVGGVVSYRSQWDEEVEDDETFDITLYNPNNKEVGSVEVTTDSMGVFSADFLLPENGLPGNYRIYTSRKTVYIRVEEYKRPTFEVKTEEAPAVQMPVDSITLTGLAINYNGAPVRSARVVGKYRFSSARYYWWGSSESRYDQQTDTVQTDTEGRFHVTIPIEKSAYELYYGQMLTVQYVVTSPTGETHTAEQSVYLCSKPVRLFTNIPDKVDKDKLTNWSLLLVSSTGKELEGEIQLNFEASESKTTVSSCSVKSGSSIRPDFLKDVPSGNYNLKMQAILNGDTATAEQQIVIFSQHDTRLVTKKKLWLYVPENIFSDNKAARIMVGSSEKAYIYYTLISSDELVEDRLIVLNDSLITIDLPYEKRFGEGLQLNVMTVLGNEVYKETQQILLQQPDKQLRYKWTTFRDKLQPGQKETWQLQVKRPDGTAAPANLMATLYDASLDALHNHSWSIFHNLSNHVYKAEYYTWFRGASSRLSIPFHLKSYEPKDYSFASFDQELFDQLQYGYVKKLKVRNTSSSRRKGVLFGAAAGGNAMLDGAGPMVMRELVMSAKSASADEALQGRIAGLDVVADGQELGEEAMRLAGTEGEQYEADPAVTLRENFNETAFFYPTLRADAEGNVNIEFTLPESLTTWRLLGLAHTQDMLTAILDEKVVAQKDLMAQLSLPRFLRQGDKATLSATLYNISSAQQKGRAVLTILDAATEKVMLKQRVNFDLSAKSDSVFLIPYNVPEDCGMLIVRWAAEATACSDGEQRYLPVLSSKEWITDTRALTYTKAGTYTEDIEKMFSVKNATNKQLTVEYVSQPAWYAIQALPSLAWPQNIDVLSLTTAYYAGAIAGNIAEQNPLIGQAIDKWKQEGKMQKSKLLQNEELKNVLLEETPWISLAEQETERIQRLSTLFDEATQSSLQKEYLDKIRNRQSSDGSFSWYPGMKGSYYMTREVAYLLTRLKVLTDKAPETILNKAVQYIREDRPTYLGTSSLRYLYVLYNSGVQMDKKDKHNADSLMKVMVKHPENLDLEQRALAAIVLHKAGKKKDAMRYLESVKQFLVTNDEGLTYFEFPEGSFTSINRKQHIHVQVLEALMTLSPQETKLIDGMRRYLLRHKRTSEWDTPVNSANAVYALLLNNSDLLQQGSDATLTLNGKGVKHQLPEEESSFGFIRQRVEIGESASQQINKPASASTFLPTVPRSLTVEKRGDHESWGGIYAQYLAPISEVESAKGNLNIRCELYADKAAVGKRTHVRYVIEADRDYEYVAVNVPRAAAMEPADQISGYRWNHGLAYYRAVRDASTQYFIDYLPRGTYVIEEELLIERPGEYSSGIATIQCLYAPEFSGRAADKRVNVKW